VAIFPKDVYTAIKSALDGATLLPYVDTVVIQKYRRDNIPDFTNYAIIISPIMAEAVIYEAAQRFIANRVELILLAKVRSRTEEDIIMADTPGGSPPNVGVLAMYEDVFRTLYKNNLSGAIELYPKINELDAPSQFDILVTDENREDFIIEARVIYNPRGQRFVDLA